jgi:site-specific recombinase XerD
VNEQSTLVDDSTVPKWLVHTTPIPVDSSLALVEVLPADEHPAAVYLASLAAGSRRTMRTALHTMAGLMTGGRCDAFTLQWGALRYQHAAALRAVLAERYAPATTNKMLAALRGVLKAAWRLGQIPTEEYQRAVDLSAVRGETLSRGRAVASGELRALFTLCADTIYKDKEKRPGAVRDAALLAVLYGGGLRRSEVAALQVDDYNPQTGELRVRSGKGRKALPGGARGALEAWLEVRAQVLPLEEGPLFVPVLKSGRLLPKGITDQAVLAMLMKRAKQAGVKHLSPHDLRRSFISDLLDAGADISTVQKLAGHANVTTTTRYDRRG